MVSNLFIQHRFLDHLLLCAKYWSYTNWEVDWQGLPLREVAYQLKCRGFLKSWVNHFPLAHELKITSGAESETSLLSSYCLPTLEPPTTRGTAGATVKAISSWQVERLADGSIVQWRENEADRKIFPTRALNKPRWGVCVGLCSSSHVLWKWELPYPFQLWFKL